MTDNKDALSAFDLICEYAYYQGRAITPKDIQTAIDTVKAALTASPSAGVDVSRVRLLLQQALVHRDQKYTIDKVVEAIAALQTLPDAQGWLPIETAPRDGTCVIVYAQINGPADKFYVGEARQLDNGWFWVNVDPTDYNADPIYPTHWQKLPSPPQPAKDKSK